MVATPDGEVLAEVAEGIGVATNNVAEYTAAIEGLRRAAELGASEVLLRSDSRLLIEQLSGRFRVKNPTLQRRRVLGDVVRGHPDPFALLRDQASVGTLDVNPDPSRAGVPPRRAVGVDDQAKIRIRRQYSHLRMPSSRFSRSR